MSKQLIAELLQAANPIITEDVCFNVLLKYCWTDRQLEEELIKRNANKLSSILESLKTHKSTYHALKFKVLDSGEIIVNNGDGAAASLFIGTTAIQLVEYEKVINELMDEHNSQITEYKTYSKKKQKFIKTTARYCKWYIKSILIKEQVENSGDKLSFHKICEQIAGDENLDTSTITKGISKFQHFLDHFGKSRKSEISENS